MGTDSEHIDGALAEGDASGASSSATGSASGAWKKHAGAAAAIVMAILWLVAGVYKLTTISQWQLMLTQILVPVPLSLAGTMAVIMGDLTAGVLLLRPSWRRLGGMLSSVMLIIFMGYFAINYEALRGADCSCFPWVKRAVGPEFFWTDGAMLLLSVAAAWLAPPLRNIRGAVLAVAGIVVISLSALAIDKLGPQPELDVPATIAAGDAQVSLHEGKVFIFFFNPMCPHCVDAGINMSKHKWQAIFVGVATEDEDLTPGFIDDTGLRDVKLTRDIKTLREALPFENPPYAVAIEDGRVTERFPFFEEPELGEKLRELGLIE
ncbi:MAG: hypothetical protein O2968_19930 [Acidobacteria bacterium]|nr:hypothetical protein [Acidobacteriota bacterium]